MVSSFICYPVVRRCLWKKTQIDKKQTKITKKRDVSHKVESIIFENYWKISSLPSKKESTSRNIITVRNNNSKFKWKCICASGSWRVWDSEIILLTAASLLLKVSIVFLFVILFNRLSVFDFHLLWWCQDMQSYILFFKITVNFIWGWLFFSTFWSWGWKRAQWATLIWKFEAKLNYQKRTKQLYKL